MSKKKIGICIIKIKIIKTKKKKKNNKNARKQMDHKYFVNNNDMTQIQPIAHSQCCRKWKNSKRFNLDIHIL